MKELRELDLVVISDIHLGTYGCHARELCSYFESIRPKILVLNGDIIDCWQFSKWYWPSAHMEVIHHLFRFAAEGTQVYYLTGNHDEVFRRFSGISFPGFILDDKLVLELDGKKAWFFHGDVFDITMKKSPWLARLGAIGYDTLILINRAANFISEKVLKKGRISLSKRIKESVKQAVSFISDFENTACEIASKKGYDYVICGHIHQPVIRPYSDCLTYMNSGDWVENLTTLEYHQKNWTIYQYSQTELKATKAPMVRDISRRKYAEDILKQLVEV